MKPYDGHFLDYIFLPLLHIDKSPTYLFNLLQSERETDSKGENVFFYSKYQNQKANSKKCQDT